MDNKFALVLCKQSELVGYRRVFSEAEISPVLSIHVPHEYYNYSMYEISQVSSPKYEIDIPTYVRCTCSPAWVDIRTGGLDITPGQHDYVIRYYDPAAKSYICAYFGYIIQTEQTDKSYLYMNR